MTRMGLRRGHAKLSIVLAACALAVGGVIVALVVTRGGDGTSATPTTGAFAPITVSRPAVPVIGGGIPVDVEPPLVRTDFSTILAPLPGTNRYRITISNTSNLGAINSFQWYPPNGIHIVKVLGSSAGRCTATGVTGFGGNQFPGIVLYPNILCDRLALKAPSCTCQGDGGVVSISFVTDKDLGGSLGDVKMRTATLGFKRVPAYLGG
jgi:hypothetical protein